MPKTRNEGATRKRRKRTLARAKGFFGNKSRLYRYAKEAIDRAGQFSYRDRRRKKSDWRRLWIARINIACRRQGIAYSRFMNGLRKAGIGMDRKALSELAIADETAFARLVDQAKEALKD